MFRILRPTAAMVVFIVVCFIGSYPVYMPMTVLLAIYFALELVALCVEAEIRMRTGMKASRINFPNKQGYKWWIKEAATQHAYQTDEKLRSTFRRPFRWLPAGLLWRISLWMYFW